MIPKNTKKIHLPTREDAAEKIEAFTLSQKAKGDNRKNNTRCKINTFRLHSKSKISSLKLKVTFF